MMNADRLAEFAGLPGGELISRGLADLQAGDLSEFALLVLIAKPRLARLGITVKENCPAPSHPIEHALYTLLEDQYGDDAYGRYNSLLRRTASFAHALERELSARRRVH